MEINSKDVRAILMAGGKGTRLRPLTAVLPKPIVPLGDKPILEILLGQLKSAGLERVTICTGYLAELIMAVGGDGTKYGMKIDYQKEDEPCGTAGPIAQVDDTTDPVLVMNGDLLTSLNFSRILDFHVSQDADITIAVYPRDVLVDFGVVRMTNDNKFLDFDEKPVYPMHVSMGVNVLSRAAVDRIPNATYMDMPDLILAVHRAGGKVCCYHEDCFWLDIGRMDDYALAQEQYEKNNSLFDQEEKCRESSS